ncbi:IMPACT family protein [Marinimicrobium alkaliphilum]|uniref:IMPACT family protein n=1 Tax=Marinimicrobium alkaliphilum TaxID=2202654 RepID=UPI000DB92D33|nr:YigZ family protein [Marinimicrobium alkaliphilum]
MTDTASTAYPVLASPCEWTHEEKRSQFIALLEPVTTREQAMAALERIRTERPGASHYCWAYILGPARQPLSQAFSDDGEPGGTAGKPMLNVLAHRDAGDTLAVVVRIFGGVKLGAGGLVRAYGAAVSGALDLAQWRTVTPSTAVTIHIDFAQEAALRHALEQRNLMVESAAYSQRVSLDVAVPMNDIEQLRDIVQTLTAGQGELTTD